MRDVENDLNISVNREVHNTHTFVFESRKKDADNAFRKKNKFSYKTISVKKASYVFTTPEM
jgi:hypothetical protein